MLVLIDGDVLKYSCGFASDAQAKKRGEEYEELRFCLNGVNKTITSIMEATGADEYLPIISHPNNRRKDIYPEYKANRDPLHKPYWFGQIHDFLFERHGAILSGEGDEADDAMGILQCLNPEDTIIATIDKDLDGIPGWHYNFSKNRKENGTYYVEEVDADRFFYKQIITGDSADNIPGLFKTTGQKATKKWLAPLDDVHTPRDMFDYVVSCYEGKEEWVKWVGDLLWIKREETGVWLPK